MSSASGRPPIVPPPARRDSTTAIWWILGIVGGGIVVMVFLALMVAGYVAGHSHIDSEGKNVDIQTPVGELKVNQNPTGPWGSPVYPAAPPPGKTSHPKA